MQRGSLGEQQRDAVVRLAAHSDVVEVSQLLQVGLALALDDLCALDLERYPHEPMLDRIWQLRENVTAYDAAYIALAEALGAPLLTFDAQLAGAPGHTAQVELLE